MKDLITDRTPFVIAAEINTIRHQTGKILLAGAIEIGRRLKEAKELLSHGEWGKWLEKSVSYSQKTAENLIRIFDAYGSRPPAILDDGAQVQGQELPSLSYTQAFLLLGVPEEDRAQFIAELDIKNMSTRELQKAVSERSQALKEREQTLQKNTDLQKALDDQAGKLTRLNTEHDGLKMKAEDLRRSQTESEAKAGKLEKELISIKQSINFKEFEKIQRNLNAAYNRASANKIAFLYESLDRIFKELAWELSQFAAKDPNVHEVYRNKVIDLLTRGLKTKM